MSRGPAWVVCLVALAGCDGRPALRAPARDASLDKAGGLADVPEIGTYVVELNPLRQLDLVFMIDNSPSMAPKQDKLRANFPRLIAALKNPIDGSLPDLRVAIIDSDLGTAGALTTGSCGPDTIDGSLYGDMGRFQMIGARACGVTDGNARWLEYSQGRPVNFTGAIDTVFGCLAGNLGTLGCGEEHQLQAFEFALVAKNIGNDAQQGMLRAKANLGLVFLSDEDDCSAAPNDGMFGDKPGLRRESPSLRCVTRSIACNDRNLSQSPPGYPTDTAFAAPLLRCHARTDACPSSFDGKKDTDTSQPTSCSPLRSVQRLTDEIKGLKVDPAAQIFVVGIFGWPLDEGQLADAQLKIAPIPNPNTADTANPQIYETWPVCYDPDHLPNHPDTATGFDVDAAGWGAMPGLRLSSFVDAFGDNGLKFSICQRDFSEAMRLIGGGLARKMQNLCVPERITSFASCTANTLVPDAAGNDVPDANVMRSCDPQAPSYPCYALTADPTLCPGPNLLVLLDRGPGVNDPFTPGTKLQFRCQ
jgi:hypothetical protein